MRTQHTVELLHASPLHLASHGARTCWDSHDKSDTTNFKCSACNVLFQLEDEDQDICPKCGSEFTYYEHHCGSADKELIDRVGNKFRHASILEHLNYTFYIEGISRACLQELSRHRHTSPSVKSTRYTLKELKDEQPFTDEDFRIELYASDRADQYLVWTDDTDVDATSIIQLELLRRLIAMGKPNDKAKYCLPEAYKVSEQLTINARSLQNFLSLRSDKSALWEIRQLATSLYEALPVEHQYLFTHCMKEV